MLGRAPRRLVELSLRRSSLYNSIATLPSLSSVQCSVTRHVFTKRSFKYTSSIGPYLPRARRASRVTSSRPPVPQDEYEELKTFLSNPMTSGPSMERAKDIVSHWMEQYLDPSMPGQDATVMVMVAQAMQRPHFVIQVYTRLRDAGVSPSPITLEYSAAACAQLGQWQTALEIIESMHEEVEIMPPSQSIYENAIRSCHVAKKWMKAKHLVEEMRTYKLKASIELYVASVRLCIDSNEATATRVLLDALLRAYDEDLEEAQKQGIVSDLFIAALNAQSLPQALFFRDELLARHVPLSEALNIRLIHLCAVERRWHMARVLLKQFVDKNAPPPQAAPSKRYTDDIQRLFHEMEAHDMDIPLTVYNAALRNFGQLSLLKEAVAVYSDMCATNVTPDATSFAALICACGTHVEQSNTFFTELQRQQCEPTLNVVHGYLLVPSRAKQWEEVLRRYGMVQDDGSFKDLSLESDVRIQSLVAIAYGRLGQSEKMLRVFTSMKVKGMEPNLHVYGEAMFAYIHLNQWRHALMLFDHLFQQQTHQMQEKRMLENFAMLWDAAILACVCGEETERAANLYDTIVKLRIPISMVTGERLTALLTGIPSETLWKAFKSIPSLHRTKTNERFNPRVQNAVLKRAVEENDTTLAEQIVADGEQEMQIVSNSMTYALMLRLYSRREDQYNFHAWWRRMAQANVKHTLYIFRALMHQLSVLSVDCENVEYLNSFASFLEQKPLKSVNSGATTIKSIREYAAELGGIALDVMDNHGLGPDAICLQNYLLLSQDPTHVARVLACVENAIAAVEETTEGSDYNCGLLTSRLLHTLFTALGTFPDGQRVRQLLVRIVKDLPSEVSEDALAAFCAANNCLPALQLLRELLESKCDLQDGHILYFLTNSYSCEASAVESKTSRPRSGDGVIVDMVSLLCASKHVKLEASCFAFLIRHIVELSKWQERDVYEIVTQEEIESMKKLLAHAFSAFSITQVQEFLAKVVDKDDLRHLKSVLDELQPV